MFWIGRKKIAFIPVYRPNAIPPDVIPADWKGDILRRVLFDPANGVDRSLRTYIHAASSGRADLDGVVMPMVTIDQQDVPPGILEGQLGSQLRDQGFDAAAIVMLGGAGAGTAQPAGFWARFVMAEGVGVWAMELTHCLTGYWDLYIYLEPPDRWFDNMACACGTHPSAFTKVNFGWLDPSAIIRHTGRVATYDLHAVGLVQPPPSGRCTAVQVGPSDPFLMIEARQMVDQFDGWVSPSGNPVIPNNGVIVYEVVTSDEDPNPDLTRPKIQLRTRTPLTVGQAFTSATNVTVSVTGTTPGGFLVVVDDPNAPFDTGQLLSYGDAGTPGNVSAPVIVGFGGWQDFKFLFSGRNVSGEDRIYAVDQSGQLLSYGDAGTPGNVSAPVIVGFGGWQDFKFLFSGRNVSGEDRIYAVDQSGQLLSYGDAGTPGNVSAPVIVGFGGWLDFKFLFSGRNVSGEDRIYAVVA